MNVLDEAVGIGDYPQPPRNYRPRKIKATQRATQHPRGAPKCLFVILRGLDIKAIEARAAEIAHLAFDKGNKSVAILSTDDFLREADGTYSFDGAKLHQAHRRNFERANAMFMQGVDVVILANVNYKRSHFHSFAQCASWYYYEVAEEVVGTHPADLSTEELTRISEESPSKVPVAHLRRWALDFDE